MYTRFFDRGHFLNRLQSVTLAPVRQIDKIDIWRIYEFAGSSRSFLQSTLDLTYDGTLACLDLIGPRNIRKRATKF